MKFAKGHGTQNDFVVLPDLHAELELSPAAVAALCDRRRGLGADGVLRVTTACAARSAGVFDQLPEGVADDDWYMDYRNADGSIAQMCGNGVRVFAHYLRASGLEDRDEFVVGSLAGPRPVTLHAVDGVTADVTVEMGKVNLLGPGRRSSAAGRSPASPSTSAIRIWPAWTPPARRRPGRTRRRGAGRLRSRAVPRGRQRRGADRTAGGAVAMRVHERGCGRDPFLRNGNRRRRRRRTGPPGRPTGTLRVRIPGGEVTVTVTDATSYLRGPSVLVAQRRDRRRNGGRPSAVEPPNGRRVKRGA